ncbi:hypothetical protein Esi_0176_0024 [Ectocarpus siliculosus]|uniref:Uncharacterized protein n=1 Tax=Ectocarpus siliculosus TaxID=2880 RepID=D8LGR0_ECTSI|nr:hypothetical protein Esi_0176_0024 [Ectocarpus siliculosus]|eukprot:CBN79080.1 hypothetical protein Esi_0176_0024 [Ectocarpus siliculosus]
MEWKKHGTDSHYMKGHHEYGQITTETGSPFAFDGFRVRHLFKADPKLWKISLSGFRRPFRGVGDQPTHTIRNDPNPQRYMFVDSRPEHNWTMLQKNFDSGGIAGEFFIEHADVDNIRKLEASAQRLIAADFLNGGKMEGKADYCIPVYIICALNGGESYLGLDDHDNVIRTDAPHVWYLGRGRNAIAKRNISDAAMKVFDRSVASAAAAATGVSAAADHGGS